MRLLNCCQKLTHLSLTGVHAFMRDDLSVFCREAPREFTEHQRQVFCVYSGTGVSGLRRYLNTQSEFADFSDGIGAHARRRAVPPNDAMPIPDVDGFDEADGVEDDDMGDGSEIAMEAGPDEAQNGPNMVIPPPPPAPSHQHALATQANVHGSFHAVVADLNGPASQVLPGPTTPTQISLDQSIAMHPVPANQGGPSMAPLGNLPGPAGPSTASFQAPAEAGDEQAG